MTQLYYDDNKFRIRVCGGMNCSAAGGGRKLEEALQDVLTVHGIADQVEIYRAHCLGECQNGPCVRISGERFYHVQPEDASALVREEILPRLSK